MTTIQPTIVSDCDEDSKAIALIRRVLCPQAPPNASLEQLLPALTSSPGVDFQLYAFLAFFCRDFLFSWYSKITNDRVFVDEVIQVIAHTTRLLEQRLRQTDLETLLLDELPALFDNHVHDFRQCSYRHNTTLSPHLSFSDSFHNLQPHPALKGSAEDERLYLKFLSSGVLAVLLPTEDLQSDCERTFLREILSSLFFGNIVNNLSEPFVLYEIFTNLVSILQNAGNTPLPISDEIPKECSKAFPDSDEGRKKRKARKRDAKAASSQNPPAPSASPPPSLSPTKPNKFMIYAGKALTILLLTISTLSFAVTIISTILQQPRTLIRRKKPILRMSMLRFLSNLLKLDSRQPWLKGNISLALSPLSSRPAGSFVDRILSYLFQKYVARNERVLVQSMRLARESLFPNGGSLAVARIYPTPVEQLIIKQTAEEKILEVIPTFVKNHYFGTTAEDHVEGIREYLEMMSDKRVNKHLVYQIMDLVVSRLMPELVEEGPGELIGERVPRREETKFYVE